MSAREEVIRSEFHRFQDRLRLARWAAIDEALCEEGMPELSSAERDEVDMATAFGVLPFEAAVRA